MRESYYTITIHAFYKLINVQVVKSELQQFVTESGL